MNEGELKLALQQVRQRHIGDQRAVDMIRELQDAMGKLNKGKGLGFMVHGAWSTMHQLLMSTMNDLASCYFSGELCW